MFPYLRFGQATFPVYSLMIGLGLIAFVVVFVFEFKQFKLRIGLASLLITTAIGGAAFYGGAFLWDNLCHAIDGTAQFGHAGISFLGGVCIGLPIYYGVLWFTYRNKLSVRIMMNTLIPCLLIAHAFGRIGCLAGGCCFGRPSGSDFGLIYPEGSEAALAYGYGTPLLPTPIIESIVLFVFFALFTFVPYFKQRRVMWYCLFYGIYRFFAEYMRGDSRGGFIPGLSPSQFLSILLVLTGIAIFIIQRFVTHDDGKIPEGPNFVISPLFNKKAKEK